MKRYTSPWKARFTDNPLHKAALAGRHGLGNENGGSIAFIVVDEIWRDAVLCRLDECEWLQADRKKTDWYLQLQLSGGDLNATDKRGLPIDRNQEFEDFCDFVDECENFALENYEGNPDLGFAETVYLSFHKAIGVFIDEDHSAPMFDEEEYDAECECDYCNPYRWTDFFVFENNKDGAVTTLTRRGSVTPTYDNNGEWKMPKKR